MLFIFLTLLFGILTAYAFLVDNLSLKIISIIPFIVINALHTASYLNYKNLRSMLKPKRAFFLLLIVVYLFGASNVWIQLNSFKPTSLNGLEYTVEARITDKVEVEDNKYNFYLENARVVLGEDNISLTNKIKLFVTLDDEAEPVENYIGSTIVFVTKLYDYDLIRNGELNTYVYSNNLGYYGFCNLTNLVFYDGKVTASEAVRINVKNLLEENLSSNNASLSYAVLFGDKSLLETEIYENFVESGVAHLLAVSGLHIGFLILFLVFLLGLLKLNKKVQFIVLLILLAGYAYLCGFSASVVRASIMALTLLFARIIGEQNDSLSSVSFAGILILVLFPISLFTAGFLLSFASVFSIILLYPIFYKILKRIYVPSKISALMALTIAAQIGTLPIVANYFGELNLLSVISNLVILPLFTVGYFGLMLAALFTSVWSIFGFLFVVPEVLFRFVTVITQIFSTLNFSMIKLITFSLIGAIIYYAVLFLLSKYVLLQKKQKVVTTFVLTFLLIISLVFSNMPANLSFASVTKLDRLSNVSFITTTDNKNYLVDVGEGKSFDEYVITHYLNQNKVKSLEGIIFTSYIADYQSVLTSLCEEFGVSKVFMPYTQDNLLLYGLLINLPHYTDIVFLNENEVLVENSLRLTSFVSGGTPYALKIKNASFTMLFTTNHLTTGEWNALNTNIDETIDVLFVNTINTANYTLLSGNANFDSVSYLITKLSYVSGEIEKLYTTTECGNLLLKLSYDTLNVVY